MFYTASQIVIWILLAAAIGAGLGYGFARQDKVQLGSRLSTAKADAAAERELDAARTRIAELSRKLEIATEALRGEVAAESASHETTAAPVPDPVPMSSTAGDEATVTEPAPSEDEDAEAESGGISLFSSGRLSERIAAMTTGVAPVEDEDDD